MRRMFGWLKRGRPTAADCAPRGKASQRGEAARQPGTRSRNQATRKEAGSFAQGAGTAPAIKSRPERRKVREPRRKRSCRAKSERPGRVPPDDLVSAPATAPAAARGGETAPGGETARRRASHRREGYRRLRLFCRTDRHRRGRASWRRCLATGRSSDIDPCIRSPEHSDEGSVSGRRSGTPPPTIPRLSISIPVPGSVRP